LIVNIYTAYLESVRVTRAEWTPGESLEFRIRLLEVYFTIYILLQLCIPDPIVISSRVRSHQVKPRQLNIT